MGTSISGSSWVYFLLKRSLTLEKVMRAVPIPESVMIVFMFISNSNYDSFKIFANLFSLKYQKVLGQLYCMLEFISKIETMRKY